MRCVGTRNQKSFVAHSATLVLNLVCLRLVFQSFLKDILSISDGATLSRLGKLHAYESVKAHAAGTEKRVAVDNSVIEFVYLAMVDYFN